MTEQERAAALADQLIMRGFYGLGIDLGGNDAVDAINLTVTALRAYARPAPADVREVVAKAIYDNTRAELRKSECNTAASATISALAAGYEIRRPFDPATAPGHTDMMVDPETLDAFMEENPLPPDRPIRAGDDIGNGLVAVPSEPTHEMVHQAMMAIDSPFYADIEASYRIMLAAAKEPIR